MQVRVVYPMASDFRDHSFMNALFWEELESPKRKGLVLFSAAELQLIFLR